MKSFKAIAFVLITFLFVTSALAQEWTKEQAALWKDVEASWTMWKDGDIDGALASFHNDYLGWGSEYPMPAGKAKITEWYNRMKDNYKVMMLDLTPVRISVVGDAAVVHYYFSFYGERMGKVEAVEGKNTEFYVKENGKWLLLGDHTSIMVEEDDD